MIRITALVSLLLIANPAFAAQVEASRTWTETFQVLPDAQLYIENIWGDVIVKPGRAEEIVVVISENRSAPNQRNFDHSLEVLPLIIVSGPDEVSIQVGKRDRTSHPRDRCRGCRVNYNFEVRVPPGTTLDVSTVNDGKVVVSDIQGRVSAANVNGPVTIKEATGCEEVESVNGRLDVSFLQAPGADCDFETINGDINIRVPEGTGLDVALDMFNGKVVSGLPVNPLAIPATIEETRSGGRYQYRVKQPTGVRLAGGGPTFTISSMNGDIRIENK